MKKKNDLNESKKLEKVIENSGLLNEGYSEDKKTQADIAKIARLIGVVATDCERSANKGEDKNFINQYIQSFDQYVKQIKFHASKLSS